MPLHHNRATTTNLYAYLLIDTLLLLLDLLFQLLQRCTIRRGAIGLENLYVPSRYVSFSRAEVVRGMSRYVTYSSDKGVIFFSSTSSSANSFWYFSQFWPVADGWEAGSGQLRARRYRNKGIAHHDRGCELGAPLWRFQVKVTRRGVERRVWKEMTVSDR
jgi:hypothetical protein